MAKFCINFELKPIGNVDLDVRCEKKRNQE